MSTADSTIAAMMQSSTAVGEFVNDVETNIRNVCAVLNMPIETIETYKTRLLDCKYMDDDALHQICETYCDLKKRKSIKVFEI